MIVALDIDKDNGSYGGLFAELLFGGWANSSHYTPKVLWKLRKMVYLSRLKYTVEPPSYSFDGVLKPP